jgi:hypothetical protein
MTRADTHWKLSHRSSGIPECYAGKSRQEILDRPHRSLPGNRPEFLLPARCRCMQRVLQTVMFPPGTGHETAWRAIPRRFATTFICRAMNALSSSRVPTRAARRPSREHSDSCTTWPVSAVRSRHPRAACSLRRDLHGQLMMQCGMFAAVGSFRSRSCDGVMYPLETGRGSKHENRKAR